MLIVDCAPFFQLNEIYPKLYDNLKKFLKFIIVDFATNKKCPDIYQSDIVTIKLSSRDCIIEIKKNR